MSSGGNEKQYRAAVMTSVGVLAEAFGRTATEATIAAYTIGLGGLTPKQIENATGKALRTCKFMPTPAELRELAGELKLADRGEIAWAAFERAVAQHGGYRSVCFDDPAINAAVQSLGGWCACCEMPANEFDSFLRPKFLKAYEAHCRAGRGAGSLAGTFARENALGGYGGSQVVLITTGLKALPGLPLLTQDDAKPRQSIASGLLELKGIDACPT
jgi:hypothetical protein